MEFVLTTKERKVEKRNDFHHKSYSRPGSGEGAGTQRASCSWVGSVIGSVRFSHLIIQSQIFLALNRLLLSFSLSITWSILEDPQTHDSPVWTRWDED